MESLTTVNLDLADIQRIVAETHGCLAWGGAVNLIHGDPEALEGLRVLLQEQTQFKVDVAGYRDILRL